MAFIQDPEQFNLDLKVDLQVSYGTKRLYYPGIHLHKADVMSRPEIATSAPLSKAYTIIMVNSDVILNGANLQTLHWIQSNLTSSFAPINGVYPLMNKLNTPAIAPYMPPGLPTGARPRAHRYVQLLFEQTDDGVSIPVDFLNVLRSRLGMDIPRFVRESGLGSLVAANYFTVVHNPSAEESIPATSGLPSTTTNTPSEPTDGAAAIDTNFTCNAMEALMALSLSGL